MIVLEFAKRRANIRNPSVSLLNFAIGFEKDEG